MTRLRERDWKRFQAALDKRNMHRTCIARILLNKVVEMKFALTKEYVQSKLSERAKELDSGGQKKVEILSRVSPDSMPCGNIVSFINHVSFIRN